MKPGKPLFSKGDWVRIPEMPKWGHGEVLGSIDKSKIVVFFVDGRERKLSLEHVRLKKILKENNSLLKTKIKEFKIKQIETLIDCKDQERRASNSQYTMNTICELCNNKINNLWAYSHPGKWKMYICDACRSNIIKKNKSKKKTETSKQAETNKEVKKEKRRKKKKYVDAMILAKSGGGFETNRRRH